MGTLTWGSIARSLNTPYETVTDIDQRYHNVRVALNRMSAIAMAFLTQDWRDLGPEQMWKTQFIGKGSGDFFELNFTSFAHEVMREDAKESDQCELLRRP